MEQNIQADIKYPNTPANRGLFQTSPYLWFLMYIDSFEFDRFNTTIYFSFFNLKHTKFLLMVLWKLPASEPESTGFIP